MPPELTKIDRKLVEEQLERILASSVFRLATRSRAFLRYVVEGSLEDAPPKEYSIATEVLGREPDYDPAVDATVRVEAGRVRNRLREYYDTEGKDDPVAIEIPKGGYAAAFTLRHGAASAQASESEAQPEAAPSIEVVHVPGPVSPAAEGRDPVPSSRRHLWRLTAWAAALAIVSAILGIWTIEHSRHKTPPIRSLAVLPFQNLSGDSGQDYLADGMTDELITELARLPELRVVSRTSVMLTKGNKKPLRELASELGVDTVVEGSVVHYGSRVRITAQLIDVRDDRHIWARSFEEAASDMLSIEDSIAREIASQAGVALAPKRLDVPGHISPAAQDAYLRGLYFIHRREAVKAAQYFKEAASIEPSFARAHAGLAQATLEEAVLSQATWVEAGPPALAEARRAIELDPNSGEAYTALGSIQMIYSEDWSAAERSLQRALALSPNFSLAEVDYAFYLDDVGRADEAVSHMRRALELDPLSFFVNRSMGTVLFYARRYDEALYYLHRALEMEPGLFDVVQNWISRCQEMRGRLPQAVDADLVRFSDFLPGKDLLALRQAYQKGGWQQYQSVRADRLSRTPGYCSDYEQALSELRLQRRAEAFSLLNRAEDNHCFAIYWIKVDPALDGLRSGAMYTALLARIHLAP